MRLVVESARRQLVDGLIHRPGRTNSVADLKRGHDRLHECGSVRARRPAVFALLREQRNKRWLIEDEAADQTWISYRGGRGDQATVRGADKMNGLGSKRRDKLREIVGMGGDAE